MVLQWVETFGIPFYWFLLQTTGYNPAILMLLNSQAPTLGSCSILHQCLVELCLTESTLTMSCSLESKVQHIVQVQDRFCIHFCNLIDGHCIDQDGFHICFCNFFGRPSDFDGIDQDDFHICFRDLVSGPSDFDHTDQDSLLIFFCEPVGRPSDFDLIDQDGFCCCFWDLVSGPSGFDCIDQDGFCIRFCDLVVGPSGSDCIDQGGFHCQFYEWDFWFQMKSFAFDWPEWLPLFPPQSAWWPFPIDFCWFNFTSLPIDFVPTLVIIWFLLQVPRYQCWQLPPSLWLQWSGMNKM